MTNFVVSSRIQEPILPLLKDTVSSIKYIRHTIFDIGANIKNLNNMDSKSITPLGYAVLLNRPDVVDWLINRGADIHLPVKGKSLLNI